MPWGRTEQDQSERSHLDWKRYQETGSDGVRQEQQSESIQRLSWGEGERERRDRRGLYRLLVRPKVNAPMRITAKAAMAPGMR